MDKIMKAMIWAAGLGERMQPLTLKTPKPLLKIGEHALIEHHLYRLAAAGFKDVVINIHHMAEQVISQLGDGQKYQLNIKYSKEDDLLDTGGGTVNALPLLGAEPFVIISSDIYSDFDFKTLPTKLDGLVHLVLTNNPDFHPDGDYALQADGKISLQGDKLNYAGVAVLDPTILQQFPQKKFPISKLFEKAIADKVATGQFFSGTWHNVGTPEQLSLLNGQS